MLSLAKQALLVAAALGAAAAIAQQPAQKMPLPILEQGGTLPFITQGGARVLEVTKGPGGMYTYLVQKDGKPVVFYVSPDKTVAFVGVMFDTATGRNLSDHYVQRAQQLAAGGGGGAPGQATPPAAPADAGGLPLAMGKQLGSAAVAGVTEGTQSDKTVYVFFDPQCGYCHNLHKNTRELVKAGASVKWIPVNTLGDAGLPLSVAAVRGGPPAMELLSSQRLQPAADVPLKARTDIQANTQLLKSLVTSVGLRAATPTIVYPDRGGKMAVLQDDGSNKAGLVAAFGRK